MEIGFAKILTDIDDRLEGLMYMEPQSRPQTLLDIIHQIADENVSYLGVIGGSLLKKENKYYRVETQFGKTPSIRTGSLKRSSSMPLSELEGKLLLYRYNRADVPHFLRNKTLIGLGQNLDYVIMLNQKNRFGYHEIAESVLKHLANISDITMKKGTKYQAVKRAKGEQSKILDAAHIIQKGILPQEIPKYKGYDIYALSIPAKEIGGDYYTFNPQEGYLMFVLADVEGHGLAASLHCRTIHAVVGLMSDQRPKTIIKKINERLLSEKKGGVFATLSYLELSESGNLNYVNVGHHPPYLLRNGRFSRVDGGTPPLGVTENLEVPILSANMKSRDTLIMYSDGIIEQTNNKGNEFGLKNLRQSIKRHYNLSAEQIARGVYGDLKRYAGGRETFDDDATIIVIKKE